MSGQLYTILLSMMPRDVSLSISTSDRWSFSSFGNRDKIKVWWNELYNQKSLITGKIGILRKRKTPLKNGFGLHVQKHLIKSQSWLVKKHI